LKVESISAKNFRLLKDVKLTLEDTATVIVGRNNSGKTSLTELFRKVLAEGPTVFLLEDFSLTAHEDLWDAFKLRAEGALEEDVRAKLPFIESTIKFSYNADEDLGTLAGFVIDLDPDCTSALVVMRYELKEGKIEPFFDGGPEPNEADARKTFFRLMKERIPQLYSLSLLAVDPGDDSNTRSIDISALRALLQPGFINAQRRLDDTTHREKDVLGKVIERLLGTAKSDAAPAGDKSTVKDLEAAVLDIQDQIDNEFNERLNTLIPTLRLFGYPGLNDTDLHTETVLNVERLLENNTKLRYEGANGITLPEGYNGLGTRNLIYMLFQLFDFFKTFQSSTTPPGAHLIFIEEPEVHLHPQMQEVFIRQISLIVDTFAAQLNEGRVWPVQFVITTHSSHIANEAPFQAIRYFLTVQDEGAHTRVKDLREGLGGASQAVDAEFLRKYLTLTRCDLFFADKAILIEGTTERLLMPEMIKKTDIASEDKLASQYISVVEVGGAYAHHFFALVDFLEVRTLIVTDIDSVNGEHNQKCKVSEGTNTSNACIKKWYGGEILSPVSLTAKGDDDKVQGTKRLAYQMPETGSSACGRSFEDSFMLANAAKFNIEGSTDTEKAESAYDQAATVSKTDFALKYALDDPDWAVPKYITDGLQWLAANTPGQVVSADQPVLETAAAPQPEGDNGA
jgi:putative ATP-dependent endonuclease of OLD family